MEKAFDQFKTLTLGSETFDELRNKFDAEILRVLEKLLQKKFDEGKITLTLSIVADTVMIQTAPHKFEIETTPLFEWKISTKLTQEFGDKGSFSEADYMLSQTDDSILLVRVPSPQMTMDEITANDDDDEEDGSNIVEVEFSSDSN